jgi:transcription initiation factor IIF auxiliary subunit
MDDMVRFNNYAKFIEKRYGRPYHRWRVFVDEPDSVLDQIDQVEYILHATFPQPRRVLHNREDKFALETAGWGEFTMLIDVKFRDGRVEKVPYWLDLSKNWPNEN